MAQKVIIDCDPGIDDAVALCIALFDPRIEVLAITATAGTVDAAQATTNVNAIVGHLDPARYPRLGKATPGDDVAVFDDSYLHGSDGLGGCNFEGSDRQHLPPSEKVIGELLRKHPNEITLVCLGPLTNLARLCKLDPTAIPLINKVVISGGTVDHPGNATAVAEYNMYFDARSAKQVFASATTKSLVPLDVTEAITFGVELLDQLPSKDSRVGHLLHQILPFVFHSSRQRLGREIIPLYDATVLSSVLEPSLFEWQELAGKVETSGELSRGATVFDRRLRREWQVNMEVAAEVDVAEVKAMIVRSLRFAGQQS